MDKYLVYNERTMEYEGGIFDTFEEVIYFIDWTGRKHCSVEGSMSPEMAQKIVYGFVER